MSIENVQPSGETSTTPEYDALAHERGGYDLRKMGVRDLEVALKATTPPTATPAPDAGIGDTAPAGARGWQPIASAPKDNTVIRLYAQGGGFGDEDFNPSGSVEGFWSDGSWCGAFWDGVHDTWYRRDGIVPTHWRHLPDAPGAATPQPSDAPQQGVAAMFMRDACESEVADPEHPDTICINRDHLAWLVQQHFATQQPQPTQQYVTAANQQSQPAQPSEDAA